MSKKKQTTILSQSQIRYLLIDSLKEYSNDVAFFKSSNPYRFQINKREVWIFIRNIHDTGIGRGNPDESRIQFSRSEEFISAQNTGIVVFFLGYFADANIFTAWNPRVMTQRINKRDNVSLYSRFSVMQRAAKQGIASYVDSNNQAVISFKPEYMGLYLENFDVMHQSDESLLIELISKSDSIEETEHDVGTLFTIDKKKFTVTHKTFKRDPEFRKRVVEGYNNRCAVCGIQLDLVEAAHIIPHSHELGCDDVRNGLCLCVLHHKALDNGLIFIDREYNVCINEDKIDYLAKVHKDGGLHKFTKLLNDQITLPSSRIYYPEPDFIVIANEIRGIIDESE